MTDLRQAAQQALEALERALETSMRQALKARIPECGEFAGIAQDVDWAATALRTALEQQAEPVAMQPIVQDKHGVIRFKRNALVDALYEHGVKTGLGLNELHCMDFTVEDRQQFAQLIGYSISGYGSLSYVTDEAYEAAERAAHGIKEGT